MMALARRLLRHWRGASPETKRLGANWYTEARTSLSGLARMTGHSRAVVAGVVAATSPRLHWVRNLSVAATLLTGGNPAGVFRTNVRKARRIMAGEAPLEVLRGNKVRAFYRALLGDETAAVVDVWMVRAAGLDPETKLTNRLYSRIAGALEWLARRLHIAVADLQATIWVAVRGRAG